MKAINDVLGAVKADEPPVRDFEGFIIECRVRPIPGLHALGDPDEKVAGGTPLPEPEYPLLTRLEQTEVAELIERHIEYVNREGQPVHLQDSFVKHYVKRATDPALPVVTEIITLPIVRPGGTILSGTGLDRQRKAIFRVPRVLSKLLPDPAAIDRFAVGRSMRFLTDEWLCDVATDYPGKCVSIACALTIIERLILPMRPAYFYVAGKSRGGKSTLINMVTMAVLGVEAAASPWSQSLEERRKAIFAYFLAGVPFLVWDNIQLGTTITCPVIEASLTARLYTDRLLGESVARQVPMNTVMAFNGNNIAASGDMISRKLQVNISAVRPDPENRVFRHPDPIGWTKAHRGEILNHLYVVLLGNPRLSEKNPPPAPTRFKKWWELCGSAVEYAAAQHLDLVKSEVAGLVSDPVPAALMPKEISFKAMFVEAEKVDEQAMGMAALLTMLWNRWPESPFNSRALARLIDPDANPPENSLDPPLSAEDRQWGRSLQLVLERAARQAMKSPIKAGTVSWALKKLQGNPTMTDAGTMTLKYTPDHEGATCRVELSKGAPDASQ